MPKSKIFRVNNYSMNQTKSKGRTTVTEGWKIVNKQAVAEALRPATMRDYKKFYFDYVEYHHFVYIDQFNSDSIYQWLASMNVQATTKRIRLKAVKAVLGRLYNAGELETNFYKSIVIRVDEETKEGTTREDIEKFLSCIDMTDYFQLRDASMVLLIWYTGIRAMTLAQLTTDMVDFKEELLTCPAVIMKNHRRLVLPLNNTLLDMLRMLIEQNELIKKRAEYRYGLALFHTKWASVYRQK
ncbi:integrase/recombinase [Tetragenococcus muriaticus PMC-11-5]|uniref:Integrase/recombinase n=1 Tax=Tetragenococcus muriaticus PMC-11-5 TaxID=1302649 RepID=A0A091C931_9ENTE|nr:site-specific integrase [Tetragenococcus muriaticus]KFN92762.1 integrase/recombinase [Tetragenococcus muriaticus PMC-11-5]